MSGQEVVAAVVLVALQLLVLRTSQTLMPSLYFTTSSLFDHRSSVAGKAVLFRLSIPFTTGIIATLLVTENALEVATLSGATAWFLVIWPILWTPSLVPHRLHPPFLGVLLAFWVAFTVLPGAAVVLYSLIDGAINGTAPEWQAQYVWALLTLPVGFLVSGLTKFAGQRLSFADDPHDEEHYDEYEEAGSFRWRLDRLRYMDQPWWLWPLSLVTIVLLIRRRR